MENSSGKTAVVTTAAGGMCLNIARDGRRQGHRHRLERSLKGSGGRIPSGRHLPTFRASAGRTAAIYLTAVVD
jgi:NAD(P)-dependent dehydrogenase (short-subunit alcohol dehydrogenase family)